MNTKYYDGQQHLRSWRIIKELTLEVVAAHLGIRTNSLSDKELGKRPVKLEELRKLAALYDIEVKELLQEPPQLGQINRLKLVNETIAGMTEKQFEAWVQIGNALKNSSN